MINGSVTLNDLKRLNTMQMELKVQSGSNMLKCKNQSLCTVIYNWRYTPILYYVSNPIMYHGMETSILYNPMGAPEYKRDD